MKSHYWPQRTVLHQILHGNVVAVAEPGQSLAETLVLKAELVVDLRDCGGVDDVAIRICVPRSLAPGAEEGSVSASGESDGVA